MRGAKRRFGLDCFLIMWSGSTRWRIQNSRQVTQSQVQFTLVQVMNLLHIAAHQPSPKTLLLPPMCRIELKHWRALLLLQRPVAHPPAARWLALQRLQVLMRWLCPLLVQPIMRQSPMQQSAPRLHHRRQSCSAAAITHSMVVHLLQYRAAVFYMSAAQQQLVKQLI
ncbi:unannotated protein [freshwater metagenome]|uniref:Unannotated protein n=1 Tax=freshwater metagenome TaxID=449393 RepID=A0A6J6M430_9ZZZZ